VQTSTFNCPSCKAGIIGITKIISCEEQPNTYFVLAELKCSNCQQIFEGKLNIDKMEI